MKEQPIYKFVAAFMDRRMYYSIEIARIVGIPAAIMIHQIHFWQQYSKDPDKWTYKTSKDWENETALTDDQQQGARKILKQLGFWEETLRGIPATKYYKLNLEKLNKFLEEIAKTGSPKIRQPRRDKTDNQLPEKQQTRKLQNSQLYKETEVTTEVTTEESAPSNAVAPRRASEIRWVNFPSEQETPTSKPKGQEKEMQNRTTNVTTKVKSKFIPFSESLSSPTAATDFKEFLQTYADGIYKHADAVFYVAKALQWVSNTPAGAKAKYADWRVALAGWCRTDGVKAAPQAQHQQPTPAEIGTAKRNAHLEELQKRGFRRPTPQQ